MIDTLCGWCLTGHHHQCAGEFTSTLTKKAYRCPCTHETKKQTTTTEPTKTKTAKAPRKRPGKTAQCVCCSAPTKGGNFLPGHDSKFLSHLVGAVRENQLSRVEAVAKLPTESLQRKLEKALDR